MGFAVHLDVALLFVRGPVWKYGHDKSTEVIRCFFLKISTRNHPHGDLHLVCLESVRYIRQDGVRATWSQNT